MLNISFDGTEYHGWQRQKNALSVCETLENAIGEIFGKKADVTGCSRTDAGVHAIDFVCNFDAAFHIPENKLPLALNTKLPPDIRVKAAKYKDESFNSRFCAHSKTYVYKTYCKEIMDPLLRNYAYHFPYEVDIDAVKSAAKHFAGTHDFSGFMTQGSSQKTTVRTVNFLNVSRNGEILEFEINANAYLYNMVRIISGTLLYVGIGRINADDIPLLFEKPDRTKAGITAAACGLYLKEVIY